MAFVRQVEYEDLAAVATIQQAAGWRPSSEADWRHLWADNPALGEGPRPFRGWVLVEGQTTVGFLANVVQAYQFGTRRLLAAIAAGLVVTPEARGSSIQLLLSFSRQPDVDLLLNTTAAPHVSKIAEFLKFRRIPQPEYDRSFFWVLRPRPFATAALRKKGYSSRISRIAGPLLAPALWTEGRLRRRGVRQVGDQIELRSLSPETIGPEFDRLWQRKLAEEPKLLAIRDSQTLRWHFAGRGRPDPPVVIGAYARAELVGYAAVVRQDAPHLALKRARLADLFVEGDAAEVVRALLSGAAAEARLGGAAMLEVIGFPSHVRRIIETLRPFELRDESWPFLFKTSDPELQAALAAESRWHACLFDGDGSL